MSKVIVIGGGASGLVAAINAARGNNEVIILEKNNSCGKKILVTGDGKCNYFNQDIDVKYYHSSNDELLDIIINNTNKKLVLDFFDSIGIIPNIRNGYYYPHSNQAITIVNALLNEVNRLGISVFCNTKVIDINKKESIFEIRTDKMLYKADKVIVATGSKAYYNNDVNSYELVGNLVNNVIKPLPALVQLKIDSNVCKKWSGVRVNSLIKLYEDSKYLKEETGELMLTNYGVSGICAMQLSSYISRGLDEDKREELFINFVYDIAKNSEELLKFLDKYNKNHNYRVRERCDNLINYKLGNAINSKINHIPYQ